MNEVIHPTYQTDEDAIRCPKCGSRRIAAYKKRFSGEKGCCGTIVLGPFGLLCKTYKQNKVRVTCLKCLHTW